MDRSTGALAEQLRRGLNSRELSHGSVCSRYRAATPLWWNDSSSRIGPAHGGRRQWWKPTEAEETSPPLEGSPTARTPEMARLEAVLFLAREPLGSRKLAQFAALADGTQARTLVRRLNRQYDETGCAFRAVEVAGGFQLASRAKFAPWLRRLQQTPVEVRLSAVAMETLSVVAYRQPILRAELEAIRGVQCGEILRQLMHRELVRIAGRSEELGRPFLYGTTKRFLQVFGLRSLEELPRSEMTRGVPTTTDSPSIISPTTRRSTSSPEVSQDRGAVNREDLNLPDPCP